MHVLILAVLIGIIAGLRAITAPAAISWAAKLGWLPLDGTFLAFLGATVTPWIFSALALGEIVNDKLPATPSRKIPPQFITRIVTGAFSGAAIGMGFDMLWTGLVGGAIGAVIGTLGGSAFRGWLAGVFGKDLPVALIEDAIAILGSYLIISHIA
ncbi:MAG: DUF4126 family protein [Acidobacteriota bacterium]